MRSIAVMLLAAACGSPAPAESPSASSELVSRSSQGGVVVSVKKASGGPERRFVTYVDVTRDWAAKSVPAADAKAWAADPANGKAVAPASRHVLIKVDAAASKAEQGAARKRADAVLARLRKGEDFAKLARELSDDAATKDGGGVVASVDAQPAPYQKAFAALAPGAITKAPVKTPLGWDVIRKDAVDEAAMLAAYRRTKSLELARRLADDIAARLHLRGAERLATNTVDGSITTILGADAARDPERPIVHLVPVDKVASPPPTCAKLIAIPLETVVVIPMENDAGFIVGKAGPADEVDESALPTAALDTPDAPPAHCRAKPR